MDSMSTLETKLRGNLLPLYEKLLSDISDSNFEDLQPFAMQWGCLFPTKAYSGLVFFGRATNGWKSYSHGLNVLFGPKDTHETIFARTDQMLWVESCAHPETRIGTYNSNKSAFWRVVRSVSRNVFGENELSK